MVAVSLALFIFDEIMRVWGLFMTRSTIPLIIIIIITPSSPSSSVTTYVSEGPRITLRYIRNEFLDIHYNH